MAQRLIDPGGGVIDGADKADINDNFTELYADVAELQTNTTQALIASGAVTAGVKCVTLKHGSVAIAATIADAAAHAGFFAAVDLETGATHTLTLTSGTFDGTNEIATFNAAAEALLVFFDDDGEGTIVANIGAVALSTAG